MVATDTGRGMRVAEKREAEGEIKSNKLTSPGRPGEWTENNFNNRASFQRWEQAGEIRPNQP